MNQIPHATLQTILEIDKNLYSANPNFGMDIFADDFVISELVVLENNIQAGRGIPVRCGYYRLSLSIQGEYVRHINQFDYQITGHTLQLIHPKDIHSFEYTHSSLEYILLFEPSFLDAGLDDLLNFHQSDYQLVQLNGAVYKRVLELYKSINQECKDKKIDYQQICKSMLSELLYLLKREKLNNQVAPIQSRAEQISYEFLALVEANFYKQHRVNQYAELLHMTPKHLSEVIKDTLGEPALTFIHKRMLKEIQYLLHYSDKNIKQIADLLHFENSSELSRFFKRYQSVTPSQYRLSR